MPVKFKRKAMKLDAFSMDEIDVRIPDEASAILDRVSARLDEPIEVIQFRETGSRNQKPDIQFPLFIYVLLSGFPMANDRIIKKNNPLQVPAENLYSDRIPEKVHFEFILGSFWRKIGKIHSPFDDFSVLETKNFEAIALGMTTRSKPERGVCMIIRELKGKSTKEMPGQSRKEVRA